MLSTNCVPSTVVRLCTWVYSVPPGNFSFISTERGLHPSPRPLEQQELSPLDTYSSSLLTACWGIMPAHPPPWAARSLRARNVPHSPLYPQLPKQLPVKHKYPVRAWWMKCVGLFIVATWDGCLIHHSFSRWPRLWQRHTVWKAGGKIRIYTSLDWWALA